MHWVAADVDFVTCFQSNKAKLSHNITTIVLHGNTTITSSVQPYQQLKQENKKASG